jgi:TDG/mug DNA glycosylase family protein
VSAGSDPPPTGARALVALARLHRSLPVGAVIAPELIDAIVPTVGISRADLLHGAGFVETAGQPVRAYTLPDVVGAGMRLLVIGLNPSPAAADAGVSFARPGNRFWPAALASGAVSRDRDPHHALDHDGVGFTDIVKRTSRTAAELTTGELQSGLGRLDRLARWLRPEACVLVGLQGWRAAVDRRAAPGWQAAALGTSPVYVMPSTSGLNARSSLGELTRHLEAAAAGI